MKTAKVARIANLYIRLIDIGYFRTKKKKRWGKQPDKKRPPRTGPEIYSSETMRFTMDELIKTFRRTSKDHANLYLHDAEFNVSRGTLGSTNFGTVLVVFRLATTDASLICRKFLGKVAVILR